MLRPFIIFVNNYSYDNFIKEIWGEDPMMVQHLQQKFDGYAKWDRNSTSLMVKFLSELSSDKLADVENHIKANPQRYS